METKYRFHWYIYLVSWSIPVFLLIAQTITRPIYKYAYHDILTWVFVSSSLLIAIVSSTGYCAVNDKGLRLYSGFKNKYIAYDEIKHIVLLSPQKLMGISAHVCIFSKDKKIYIISWTKNYEELLKRVVTEAEKRGIQGIDQRVVDLLCK